MAPSAHAQHGLQWAESIGMAYKTQHLLCSWALPNDSKNNEASFLTNLLNFTSCSDGLDVQIWRFLC